MDYMILSFVFFYNNIFPPHIAAGLNLAFWPFGTLFRRSGAFFIRRSFRGSILYPALFSQYIHVLIKEGYPIEFFIEGGRSRSGKMVLPKLGFLSILINGYGSGCCEDLSFVPIAISYDRVMEEKAYLREIEGQEKPKESLRGVIRSLSIIKRRFGKIYINFDDPISLKGYLRGLKEKKDESPSIKKHDIPYYMAYKIAHRINRAMMVVPTSLTAAAILAAAKRGFSMNHLREVGSLFLDYLKHENVNLSESLRMDESLDYALKETLGIFLDEKIITVIRLDREERAEEEDPLFELNDKNRHNLEYYKNNILHFLLPISFVSVSLLSQKRKSIDMEGIKEDFAFMRHLFVNDFVFPPNEGNDRFIESTLNYMLRKDLVKENHGSYLIQGRHLADLLHFASLIQSSFEAYYVVGSSLKYLYRRILPEWRFIRRVRSTGEKMLQIGTLQRAESLSTVSYQNAIQFLIDQKIILRHKDKGLIEGTYYTLTQERKKIFWKKAKDYLTIYS
jgi:glycerol-3-phosphate O-acyltransferase